MLRVHSDVMSINSYDVMSKLSIWVNARRENTLPKTSVCVRLRVMPLKEWLPYFCLGLLHIATVVLIVGVPLLKREQKEFVRPTNTVFLEEFEGSG